MLRIAGYIDDDENVPLIARVFPDLKQRSSKKLFKDSRWVSQEVH